MKAVFQDFTMSGDSLNLQNLPNTKTTNAHESNIIHQEPIPMKEIATIGQTADLSDVLIVGIKFG